MKVGDSMVHESIIGSRFTGRIVGTATVAGKPAILIRDHGRYLRLDVPARVAALAAWNRPVYWPLALLAAAVLYMGVHPKPFTDVMNASVAGFLKHVAASKL